jgi:hypothetical protein
MKAALLAFKARAEDDSRRQPGKSQHPDGEAGVVAAACPDELEQTGSHCVPWPPHQTPNEGAVRPFAGFPPITGDLRITGYSPKAPSLRAERRGADTLRRAFSLGTITRVPAFEYQVCAVPRLIEHPRAGRARGSPRKRSLGGCQGETKVASGSARQWLR